jgi:hypothetical protein
MSSFARAAASTVITICCLDLMAIAIGVWPQRFRILALAPSLSNTSTILYRPQIHAMCCTHKNQGRFIDEHKSIQIHKHARALESTNHGRPPVVIGLVKVRPLFL